MTKQRGPITTHILDLQRGIPAVGVPVTLESLQKSGQWRELARGVTDGDGRIEDLLPRGSKAEPGTYQLSFDTKAYFSALGGDTFFPRVTIIFQLADTSRHYHVPLLLSAYGYSTYRGS